MIKVRLNTNPLDPYQRVSNLFASVLREMSTEQKTSVVIELDVGRAGKALRFSLRLLPELKGASRRNAAPDDAHSTEGSKP